jgi:TRAP transporter TAXI family solute receptor
MKRFLALFMALLLAAGGAYAAEQELLSISTGGVSGVYYPLGGGIAQVVTNHVANVEMTAEASNASAANINLIAKEETDLALVQNDVAYWAVRGENMFGAPVGNLRMIASLYPEHIQLVTLKNRDIKSFADLKGKRVGVGAPGSGTVADFEAILSALDVKMDELRPDYLDFTNVAERLQDGQIDAGVVVAGYPTSAIMSLAAQHEISLVNFSDEELQKMIDAFPYFRKDIVPADTYSGVSTSTSTPAVMAVLVCNANLSEELVYNITKAIFDNLPELEPVHAKARLISLEGAVDGASIAFHPGAAKYFAEKGMTVPQ